MHILFVITKADEIGGAQIHLLDLAEKLIRDGNNVEIIAGITGKFSQKLNECGIKVIHLPQLKHEISPINDLISIYKIRKLFKQIKPDIIAIHSSKAGIIARCGSVFLRSKVIFTAHGWVFTEGTSNKGKIFYILLEKIMSYFTHKIITVSQYDKDIALKYGVASDKKQEVIHNGVLDKYNPLMIRTDDGIVKLISIARFAKQKDHFTLIVALSEIQELNWSLDLIGAGPLENEIRDLVDKFKLSSRIKFIGETFNISDFLNTADIFILSTNFEGLPLTIIEAMSAKLPIIATDVGGVSECVRHGVNGLLVKRKDVSDLKAAITNLITQPDVRKNFSLNSRNIYLESFTFNTMYLKTINLYKKVVVKA